MRGPQVVIYGTLGIIGYAMALSARADQTGLSVVSEDFRQ